MRKRIVQIVAGLLVAIIVTIGILFLVKETEPVGTYISKGEFLEMFVQKVGLISTEGNSDDIGLDRTNKYYQAAAAIVKLGHMSAEEVVDGIGESVNKEFVASLCVKHLYFRETFEVMIEDEGELKDPQLCKDAVGHGIVELEDHRFNADDKMTYDQCQYAIDQMLYIDATTTFGEEEAQVVLKEKENIINISKDLKEIEFLNPEDEEVKEIINRINQAPSLDSAKLNSAQNINEASAKYYATANSSNNTSNIKCYATIEEAISGQYTLIQTKPGRSRYKIGDIVKYDKYELTFESLPGSDMPDIRPGEVFYGAVTNVVETNVAVIYELRLATAEEFLEHLRIDNITKSAKKGEKLPVENWNVEISCDDGLFEIAVSSQVETPAQSWRDARLKFDVDYRFTIRDLALTASGWGDIFDGNIDNAILRLDYTIEHHLNVTSENRFTPDNNRNGKFLTNLKKARITGENAPGAKAIKIARFPIPITASIKVDVYAYMTVDLDGRLSIELKTEYGTGFKVTNNQLSQIKEQRTEDKKQLEFNLEAGVGLQGTLMLLGFCPIVDIEAKAGLGIECLLTASLTTVENTTEVFQGYVSIEETLACCDKDVIASLVFSGELYLFAELISVATEETAVGKLIRLVNPDFSLEARGQITIFAWKSDKPIILNSGEATTINPGHATVPTVSFDDPTAKPSGTTGTTASSTVNKPSVTTAKPSGTTGTTASSTVNKPSVTTTKPSTTTCKPSEVTKPIVSIDPTVGQEEEKPADSIVPEWNSIGAGWDYTIALKNDGTVVAYSPYFLDDWSTISEKTSTWTDIVSVYAGAQHVVGLRSDGTVVAAGKNACNECNVSDWTGIVAIATGDYSTIGLRADGTIVVTGNTDAYWERVWDEVEAWSNIVAIDGGWSHTVGLRADGTVIAVGDNNYGECDVSGWADIIAVSAGREHTVGLKSDGTVVATGDNKYGQCNVEDWTDIVSVCAAWGRTIGLKADGTIVIVGQYGKYPHGMEDMCGREDDASIAQSWTDIVAISANAYFIDALRADGTVLTTSFREQKVGVWSDIKIN